MLQHCENGGLENDKKMYVYIRQMTGCHTEENINERETCIRRNVSVNSLEEYKECHF